MMDGRSDERTVGRTDGRTDERTDERSDHAASIIAALVVVRMPVSHHPSLYLGVWGWYLKYGLGVSFSRHAAKMTSPPQFRYYCNAGYLFWGGDIAFNIKTAFF
jgi:hypothetical protein